MRCSVCASCAALLLRFRLTAETLVATAAQQSCRGIAAGSARQDAAPAIHSRFAMNSSANSSALAASIATAAVNSSSATRQGYFNGMGHSCHTKSRARCCAQKWRAPWMTVAVRELAAMASGSLICRFQAVVFVAVWRPGLGSKACVVSGFLFLMLIA